MAQRRTWMTKTGAILSAVAGALLASAQVCPVVEWIPWLDFGAAFLGSSGVALGFQGIRRNMATKKKKVV